MRAYASLLKTSPKPETASGPGTALRLYSTESADPREERALVERDLRAARQEISKPEEQLQISEKFAALGRRTAGTS